MKCPFCAHQESKVVDSRLSQNDNVTRRRRECLHCGRRFTTYERLEELWPKVVKKDGRREDYSREKIMAGLDLALKKRAVEMAALEQIVQSVEGKILAKGAKEVSSSEIGSWVMEALRGIDKVAYIRFASVYRDFKDVAEFVNELRETGISARDASTKLEQ